MVTLSDHNAKDLDMEQQRQRHGIEIQALSNMGRSSFELVLELLLSRITGPSFAPIVTHFGGDRWSIWTFC